MAIDLRISGTARLLTLIRDSSWRKHAVSENITLGVPVQISTHGRNTQLVITPSDNASYKAKRTIYYNRIPLSEAFPDGIVIPELPVGTVEVHDLLDTLSEAGVTFLPEDLLNAEVTSLPFTIHAQPHSYGWLGSVQIHQGGGVVMNSILLDGGGYFLLDSGSVLLTG